MEPREHLDVIEREAAAFGEALRLGDAGLPVAGCPGWTLVELGGHLGSVHRWARAAVGTAPADGPPHERSSTPDDSGVHAWFLEGAEALLDILRSVDPERPCWTMGPPATARFWFRRQAQETALHRWDAQGCLGSAAPVEAEVALDGLDEAIAMFLPRQVRLGRLAKAPEVVHLVTGGTRFVVTSDADHREDPPLAVVEGAPEAMLLLLWGRIGLEDVRLRVDGDLEATRSFLDRPLTP